jgi:hypothetical protein
MTPVFLQRFSKTIQLKFLKAQQMDLRSESYYKKILSTVKLEEQLAETQYLELRTSNPEQLDSIVEDIEELIPAQSTSIPRGSVD